LRNNKRIIRNIWGSEKFWNLKCKDYWNLFNSLQLGEVEIVLT